LVFVLLNEIATEVHIRKKGFDPWEAWEVVAILGVSGVL
jgi:hypothetical protein